MTSTAATTAARSEELTAFVREVVLPGLSDSKPVIDPEHCFVRLETRVSPIHRWGIFSAKAIPVGQNVIEYTGQKIGADEVWRRSFREHLYVFWLNDDWALDGAFGGSGAEFINHSCEPNLRVNITGDRIFLVSDRDIETGEELTLDYNTGDDDLGRPCTCGAAKCSRIIS